MGRVGQSILVRSPRCSDVDALVGVYASSGFFDFLPSNPGEPIIRATIRAYLDELEAQPKLMVYLVAEQEEQLAGFCISRRSVPGRWQVQVGVRSDHRRRGVGRALLSYAFLEMCRHGPAEVEAVVHPSNRASIRMLAPFFLFQDESRSLPGFWRFWTDLGNHGAIRGG